MNSKYPRQIEHARARHGLSAAEYSLLAAAGYWPDLPPDRFVAYAGKLAEGGAEPAASIDQLKAALAALRARGVLTIVDQPAATGDAPADVPGLVDSYPRVGDVDFTPEGHRLYRAVMLEAFGLEHVQYADSGFVFDEAQRRFTVLAETRPLCLRRIAEILEAPDDYVGQEDPVRAVQVTLPQPQGAWRPNRFWLIQNGFRATVQVVP